MIVDWRVINLKFDEKMKKTEVKIEIDYYNIFSSRVRTVIDKQKWAYQESKGKGLWRLLSLLPSFLRTT
jgi:hypothetical protein